LRELTNTHAHTFSGKAEGTDDKVTGEIEIPNLSDENEVEEVDVSTIPSQQSAQPLPLLPSGGR
jgi:hypothetical protein